MKGCGRILRFALIAGVLMIVAFIALVMFDGDGDLSMPDDLSEEEIIIWTVLADNDLQISELGFFEMENDRGLVVTINSDDSYSDLGHVMRLVAEVSANQDINFLELTVIVNTDDAPVDILAKVSQDNLLDFNAGLISSQILLERTDISD